MVTLGDKCNVLLTKSCHCSLTILHLWLMTLNWNNKQKMINLKNWATNNELKEPEMCENNGIEWNSSCYTWRGLIEEIALSNSLLYAVHKIQHLSSMQMWYLVIPHTMLAILASCFKCYFTDNISSNCILITLIVWFLSFYVRWILLGSFLIYVVNE